MRRLVEMESGSRPMASGLFNAAIPVSAGRVQCQARRSDSCERYSKTGKLPRHLSEHTVSTDVWF